MLAGPKAEGVEVWNPQRSKQDDVGWQVVRLRPLDVQSGAKGMPFPERCSSTVKLGHEVLIANLQKLNFKEAVSIQYRMTQRAMFLCPPVSETSSRALSDRWGQS